MRISAFFISIRTCEHSNCYTDIGKLLKMKLDEVSARTMEVLVDAFSSSAGLSTFSYTELDYEWGEQNRDCQ
ncbi:hypothetical protein RchiOBHm_Chr4g0403241 [Rosa chinensis]|uniref:Uncharacterized protein n=1 Tax=Rosa chinensis TaxID=74649 RepID=A0A2P6QTJ1_ROSCH|nr:hypothetical protein RchiOBHm_Chr4g0403241 [Rosa chinensis]